MDSTDLLDYDGDFSEILSEYKWTIKNFSSLISKSSNGQYICSPKFEFTPCFSRKNNLQINVYPNGKTISSKGYISILLCFLKDRNDEKIQLNCEITMSNRIKVYDTQKFSMTCGIYRGFKKYIKSDALLADLKEGLNDKLTITCKIINFHKVNDPLDNLVKDFGSLLHMGQDSDVTIISKEGIDLKAHKIVLVSRSHVFASMFQPIKENENNVVEIKDIDHETLKAMLQFMYAGQVKNVLNKSKELFIAADKYGLSDLKDICIYNITENIAIDNILNVIEFTHAYRIRKLVEVTREYFFNNRKEIIRSSRKDLQYLPRDILEELIYCLSSYPLNY